MLSRKRLLTILILVCLVPFLYAGCRTPQAEASAAAGTAGTTAPAHAVPETAGPAPEEEASAAGTTALAAVPYVRTKYMEDLEASLLSYLNTQGGTWSIYVRCLDTGEDFCIREGAMTAASLIKLYIAGAYLEAVEDGVLEDSLHESMEGMLSRSDNDAANRLIDCLTMDRINDFCQRLGFADSRLNRKMLQASDLENLTSCRDCGRVLTEIAEGTFVSGEASREILDCLLAQERRHKIPAGLPEEAVCANKTGELADVENDAALVRGPVRDYVLVVMSMDLPAAGKAQAVIRDLSGMTWQALQDPETRAPEKPALPGIKPGPEKAPDPGRIPALTAVKD